MLFAMRQVLDASLVSLKPEDQECLREAARWATALRVQERSVTRLMSGQAGGTTRLKHPEVLMDTGAQSACAARIDELIRKQEAERKETGAPPPDKSSLCQRL